MDSNQILEIWQGDRYLSVLFKGYGLIQPSGAR